MSADLMKTIARVRRAMPRNADVMEICDALEQRLSTVIFSDDEMHVVNPGGVVTKFDKTAYMRDYMRKKRAEKKS